MLRSNTAGSLRPLTRARCLGQTELPQTVQGVTDAFTVPHAVKRAVFFLPAIRERCTLCAVLYIGGSNVRVFVRPRRPCTGRGALFPPFFISLIPLNSAGASCIPSPFSAPRPAVAVRPCPSFFASWPVPVKLPPLWPCWARRCPRRPVCAGPCSAMS